MKWGLNVFLKCLTPSVALGDSRSNSSLYISASPTSRFTAGLRFVFSSTVRSNHSSINSSYSNQDVDPSRSGGIFCCDSTSCCTVKCRLCAICFNQWFFWFSFVFWWEVTKIFFILSHCWDCWSPQVTPTHAGSCSRRDPLLFYPATTALRYHFVVVDMFLLWKPFVTRYNWHKTRTTKLQEFFLSWIVSDSEVKKIWWLQVSAGSLFRHWTHNQGHMRCKLTGWHWAKQLSENKVLTHKRKRAMTVAHIKTRQEQEQVAKLMKRWSLVTHRRCFRRHGCPWRCSWRWGTRSSLWIERWLSGARWAPFRALTRFVWVTPIGWWLPVRTLTRFVWVPLLPGRKWLWSVPGPGWRLSTKGPLLVFIFGVLLLLGFLDLVFSGLPLRWWSSMVILEKQLSLSNSSIPLGYELSSFFNFFVILWLLMRVIPEVSHNSGSRCFSPWENSHEVTVKITCLAKLIKMIIGIVVNMESSLKWASPS